MSSHPLVLYPHEDINLNRLTDDSFMSELERWWRTCQPVFTALKSDHFDRFAAIRMRNVRVVFTDGRLLETPGRILLAPNAWVIDSERDFSADELYALAGRPHPAEPGIQAYSVAENSPDSEKEE